jgi:CheY-like chemotaxis protein
MNSPPLVLVVEDSASTREFCELVLTTARHRVASAANGDLGLKLALELRPDVIVTGVMLDGLDGLSLLDRIKLELPHPPPPVLVMSSFHVFEKAALERGACAFLRKPIDSHDLVAAVDAALHGLVPDAEAVSRAKGRIASERRQVEGRREALLERVNLADPELNERLRFIVRWLASRFEVGIAFVTLQKGDKIRFQAAVGEALDLVEGGEIDSELTLCSLVTDASAALIVHDATLSALRDHPTVRAGFRFYAGVPLRTPDGIVLGTLCLLDRSPQLFRGEELSVLDAIADGIAAWIHDLSGNTSIGRGAFVAAGVFGRDLLRTLVTAELKRAYRDEDGVELAFVDVGRADPIAYRTIADQAYAACRDSRLSVAEYSPGVLALLLGAHSRELAAARMDAVLERVRAAQELRGVGVAAVGEQAFLLDARALEQIADDLRARSVRSGRATERALAAHRPTAA